MSEPLPLVVDLLVECLAAWHVAGEVIRDDDAGICIRGGDTSIRIEQAPGGALFRWAVVIDGRQRPAVSIAAVLRQVRQALDPGYQAGRVRVTVAPLMVLE